MFPINDPVDGIGLVWVGDFEPLQYYICEMMW